MRRFEVRLTNENSFDELEKLHAVPNRQQYNEGCGHNPIWKSGLVKFQLRYYKI